MNGPFIYFVWLPFLICLFLAWYFSHKTRHEERKMLIQNGADIEEVFKRQKDFKFPWLKLAMVVIGLSVGLLIITFLQLDLPAGKYIPDPIYPAILGFCGGISLLIAHYIDQRRKH